MDYIVYGADHDCRHERIEKWIADNNHNLLFYCDSNSAKWGGYHEYECYAPEKILEFPEATVVIDCFPTKTVSDDLRRIGVKNRIKVYPLLGFYFYIDDDIDERLSWITNHKDDILGIYDLSDEYTASVVNETIRERSMEKMQLIDLEPMLQFEPPKSMYFFDERLNPKGDITFVDGGAFIGDSIEPVADYFGNRLKKVYAFEPDDSNIRRMKDNLARALDSSIDVQYVNAGMYDRNGYFSFTSGADWSKVTEDGDIQIPVVTIDNAVTEVTGTLCIKMDIEGSEIPALIGAKKTIAQHHPYLAICLYHRMKDLWEVPKLIKDIYPNYKFYIRCGFHTILYAVPQD